MADVALTEDESAVVKRLATSLNRARATYDKYDAYYEGRQRLTHLGLAVPPALAEFETVVNWPRLGVDAVDERLDVEGFRYPGADDRDDELWRVWQANDLDEESQLGHLDALIYGRAFVCVGSNEDDETTPLVTVESPEEVDALIDPRTRRVTGALRLVGQGRKALGTLYLPDETIWLERSGPGGGWLDVDRDQHQLGEVPVVPLFNRRRKSRRSLAGVSEMNDLISLTDAAARALTNLQVASETHAVPQRGVLGASKGDFVDKDGKPLTVWETYFGAVWALANKDAKTFQFSASDLRNFHDTVNHYAKLVAGLTGLPPHYLGFSTENPASADAIRSAESRLVKRCERKQRAWSGSWEQVMRLVRQFQTGEVDEGARELETLWRDPATPTKAQQADATVKLVQSGILPIEAAWEDLGYSASRRQRLRELRAQEQADPLLERVARSLSGGAGAAGSGG